MSKRVRVIARFAAESGKGDALRDLLQTLVEPTRKETGCLMYMLWRNTQDPNRFSFVEEWSDQAALDAHLQTAHIAHVVEHMPPLLAAPFELETYELVA